MYINIVKCYTISFAVSQDLDHEYENTHTYAHKYKNRLIAQ